MWSSTHECLYEYRRRRARQRAPGLSSMQPLASPGAGGNNSRLHQSSGRSVSPSSSSRSRKRRKAIRATFFYYARDKAASKWQGWNASQQNHSAGRGRAPTRAAACARPATAAFHDWRNAGLRAPRGRAPQLVEAEREFSEYLDRLRRPRDREEFEPFMNERRNAPSGIKARAAPPPENRAAFPRAPPGSAGNTCSCTLAALSPHWDWEARCLCMRKGERVRRQPSAGFGSVRGLRGDDTSFWITEPSDRVSSNEIHLLSILTLRDASICDLGSIASAALGRTEQL